MPIKLYGSLKKSSGDTIPLMVCQDVLETCYNVLDDLWKLDEFSFPQKRMTHLMDIIAHAITRSAT